MRSLYKYAFWLALLLPLYAQATPSYEKQALLQLFKDKDFILEEFCMDANGEGYADVKALLIDVFMQLNEPKTAFSITCSPLEDVELYVGCQMQVSKPTGNMLLHFDMHTLSRRIDYDRMSCEFTAQ